MRGSTVILNVILSQFIFMGIITVGINVIYVCCNLDVNKDCMVGKQLSQIPVPLMRGHLQCRDTFTWPDRCPYKTGSTVLYNSHTSEFGSGTQTSSSRQELGPSSSPSIRISVRGRWNGESVVGGLMTSHGTLPLLCKNTLYWVITTPF